MNLSGAYPPPRSGNSVVTSCQAAVTPLRTPPHRLPVTGQVLDLAGGDVRYRRQPLRLHVTVIRPEISQWYSGEWVWVEGHELDAADHPIAWLQALVRVAAIPVTAENPPLSASVTSRWRGSTVPQ